MCKIVSFICNTAARDVIFVTWAIEFRYLVTTLI